MLPCISRSRTAAIAVVVFDELDAMVGQLGSWVAFDSKDTILEAATPLNHWLGVPHRNECAMDPPINRYLTTTTEVCGGLSKPMNRTII